VIVNSIESPTRTGTGIEPETIGAARSHEGLVFVHAENTSAHTTASIERPLEKNGKKVARIVFSQRDPSSAESV
jgi:hypothetical protein